MHLKPHFVYENKTIFVYFLTISGIIHLIIIFSTSSFSRFLWPELNLKDYGSKNNNYVIEIDLKSGNIEEETLESEELAKEEEPGREELAKKKEQLFVDTSEKTVDEVPQADTDKIGEKGSIAKDRYAGEDNINNNPRLDNDVDTPGEAPEDLATTVTQKSGLPVEVSINEPVKEAAEDATQVLVEEATAESMPEMVESEEHSVNDEVEASDEMQDKTAVKDLSETEIEETGSQEHSDDNEQLIDAEEITSENRESEIAILESESLKEEEIKSYTEKEETERNADSSEEYTKTASIPQSMLKEVVEGREGSVAEKARNMLKTPETQPINVPTGDDDAPYFEDKISNAEDLGEESFNVKKHEYAPYYKHIRDKIRLYWLLQYGTDPSINQITKGYKPIVVTFKVLPSGKIVNVVIVDSAGNELLASKIQISIQNTTLDKFPEYIDENHIDVKFSYFFF